MATEILMPRQGNTVESCLILSWKKREGDSVDRGEVLCEVETDKATFEVEAPESGTLLKVLYPEGADVPVLELIAVLGAKGEDIAGLLERKTGPSSAATPAEGGEASGATAAQARPAPEPDRPAAVNAAGAAPVGREQGAAGSGAAGAGGASAISPRARRLAAAKGLDAGNLTGSGPGGRIIERDIEAALAAKPQLTPAAIAALKTAGGAVPSAGTGLGGRVTSADLTAERAAASGGVTSPAAGGRPAPGVGPFPGPVTELPVQGIRRRIAERMLGSLQSTAQVTLTMPADARAVLAYRERMKSSGSDRGLETVNLNAVILYAVARTLTSFPDLNAHFLGDRILRFERVHLGFAVDTPRGLVVPVVREADLRSLKEISDEARRLAAACLNGTVSAEELAGGTFTVSNLGTLGIEYFTPVLNPPQVGIVGVGAVAPRPVASGGSYELVPHVTLSLTIDHQAVDGAPGARFLRALADNIAAFDLLLAG